jgi:hypothetical protein
MIEYPSIEDLDSSVKRQRRYINKHYPGFIEWLQNKYPFCESLNECLYNYANRQEATSRPLCPVCRKPVNYFSTCGYTKYCSPKCSSDSKETRSKLTSTMIERYGVDNISKSDYCKEKIKQTMLDRYGCTHYNNIEKYKQTCLERYGVENYSQSQEHLSRHDEIQTKVKQTSLDKYGYKYYTQSQKFRSRHDEIQTKVKQTCLEKYGSEYYSQSQEYQSRHDEIQTKMNNTKRLNHTFNSSQIETEFATYLTSQHVEYIRQYRSEEYPFNCDFYLPKYNLYIEIQASWVHGFHPYKSDEEIDKDTLETWKSKNNDFYNNAIETWVVRDVKKREIAKQNHLNYLEIFSNDIDEVIKCFKNSLKT